MSRIDPEGEHSWVLDRAQRIFVAKSQLRGQMWADFPPSDKIRELKERVARLENGYQQIRFEDTTPGPEDPFRHIRESLIEDALDAINYAAFFIKQLERGQRG